MLSSWHQAWGWYQATKLVSSCGIGHHFMGSANQSIAKARRSEGKSLAKAKGSRGIPARACVAKTMTWELEAAKGVTVPDASGIEASSPQAMWEAKKITK